MTRFRKVKQTLALTIAALLADAAVAQSVPSLINYQGRLVDQSGAALPIGNYGLECRSWDSLTSTDAAGFIWGQQYNVSVQANGVFSVVLGSLGGTGISAP